MGSIPIYEILRDPQIVILSLGILCVYSIYVYEEQNMLFLIN